MKYIIMIDEVIVKRKKSERIYFWAYLSSKTNEKKWKEWKRNEISAVEIESIFTSLKRICSAFSIGITGLNVKKKVISLHLSIYRD